MPRAKVYGAGTGWPGGARRASRTSYGTIGALRAGRALRALGALRAFRARTGGSVTLFAVPDPRFEGLEATLNFFYGMLRVVSGVGRCRAKGGHGRDSDRHGGASQP